MIFFFNFSRSQLQLLAINRSMSLHCTIVCEGKRQLKFWLFLAGAKSPWLFVAHTNNYTGNPQKRSKVKIH